MNWRDSGARRGRRRRARSRESERAQTRDRAEERERMRCGSRNTDELIIIQWLGNPPIPHHLSLSDSVQRLSIISVIPLSIMSYLYFPLLQR